MYTSVSVPYGGPAAAFPQASFFHRRRERKAKTSSSPLSETERVSEAMAGTGTEQTSVSECYAKKGYTYIHVCIHMI